MGQLTYTKLINSTLDLYFKGKYLEAYNFITENSIGIKVNEAQVYNFRYAIACKQGLTGLAIDLLREAIVQKGFWYSYDYLMEDEDLAPLKIYDDFHKFANVCKYREGKAKATSKPTLKIINFNNVDKDNKKPLLISLHGNEENVYLTEDYWTASVKKDYLLALPQSSQIGFSHGYFWNDLNKSLDEIKNHYNEILKKNNIDDNKVIIAGFSAGGRAALYSLLNSNVNAKGFILVAPWLPEINDYEHLIEKLKNSKGYIICGDRDEDCLEGCGTLVKMLNERNIKNVFKVVKDLDHDYPGNFEALLEEAIEFIES